MTNLQKIQIRLSAIAARLGEISGLEGEAFTDEIRSEFTSLQSEHAELHVRQQAAILSEATDTAKHEGEFGNGDGEPAEIRSLLGRAHVGSYLAHAVAGTGLAGAEGELNAALECGTVGASGGTLIPWRMLDVPNMERRADVPSTTTELSGPVVQRPILQRLFGRDILDALGVRIDPVPAGQAQWPLLTAGVAPVQKAEKAAAPDAIAPTFGTQTLVPKRLTGRYQFTVEQTAQISGNRGSPATRFGWRSSRENVGSGYQWDGRRRPNHGLADSFGDSGSARGGRNICRLFRPCSRRR